MCAGSLVMRMYVCAPYVYGVHHMCTVHMYVCAPFVYGAHVCLCTICVWCTCMSVHHMCVVIKRARRGHQIPWDWSYRGL